MNKIIIYLLIITSCFVVTQVKSAVTITMTGELQALKSDSYSPPKVKDIWQYTIAFMAEDGSIVKQGAPVLMFKTDAIQTKLLNAQGKLGIKLSELNNKKVNKIEVLEKKSILIEEKKMELDKAIRKSELPQSLLSKNDYYTNQLRHQLANKDYAAAKLDLTLTKQKSNIEEQILTNEIDKLKTEIKEYSQSIASMKMPSKSEGIAMHKSSWNGNKFAVGDTVWGGQRVVEVANLSKVIAKLEIKENHIKHIKLGQIVKIKLDSLPDKEFLGVIENLAKVVKIKSKNQPSKILEAIVHIKNIDTETMRPGMRLSAEIEIIDNIVLNRERIFYCGKAEFCQNSSLSSSNSLLFSSNNEKLLIKTSFPSLRILSRSSTNIGDAL